MVNNELNVTASYNNEQRAFRCTQVNFLLEAADKFKIDDIRNVELYHTNSSTGKKRKITKFDIQDLMFVEIEDKRTRNSQPRIINQSHEKMITKLQQNSTLTGQERLELVTVLRNYDAVVSNNKRKIDDVDTPESKKVNKKVQVIFPSRESTTQTDKMAEPASLQEAELEDKQATNKMRKLVSNSDDVDRQEVAKLMADSFDDRRLLIRLKSPPVSQIKEKYPLLFRLEEVKNEVRRIFYSEKPQEFIDNMYKYAPLVIQKCKSDSDLLKKTKKAMDKASTNVQKKYAEVVGSVFILTAIMKEQWSFIHLQDYPSGSEDIYPHIDASAFNLKELFHDKSVYPIIVEGKKLCEANNFLEAVLCLMAAYFIFNIDYPQSCRQTMIMFEKLYLKANDTEEIDIESETSQMIKLLELEGQNLRGK